MPSSRTDYTVLETVGTGTFGTCVKIRRNADDKILVWKELNYGQMSEREKQMLVSEVNLLREFRHPHIVRYFDRIIEREKTTIYIVMEYCENGDLASFIKRRRRERKFVDEGFVWRMLAQLLSAVHACHQRKEGIVLHRDLKPANVFLDKKNNAKLGDFGLARVLSCSASLAQTYVGTPYYMSPEQINEQSYNFKSDIWSLGCLTYELAALHPPFDATTQAQLVARIRDGRVHRLPPQYSEGLNAAIRLMLQQDPLRRPGTTTLLGLPHVAAALDAESLIPTTPTSAPPSPPDAFPAPPSYAAPYIAVSPAAMIQAAVPPLCPSPTLQSRNPQLTTPLSYPAEPTTPSSLSPPSPPHTTAPRGTPSVSPSPVSFDHPIREKKDMREWLSLEQKWREVRMRESAVEAKEEELRIKEEMLQRREEAALHRERQLMLVEAEGRVAGPHARHYAVNNMHAHRLPVAYPHSIAHHV